MRPWVVLCENIFKLIQTTFIGLDYFLHFQIFILTAI